MVYICQFFYCRATYIIDIKVNVLSTIQLGYGGLYFFFLNPLCQYLSCNWCI